MVLEDGGWQWNPLDVGAMLWTPSYHLAFAEGYERSIDGVGPGDVIGVDGTIVELVGRKVVFVLRGGPTNPRL